jgi:predicted MPP superfamily phosphohydrolase
MTWAMRNTLWFALASLPFQLYVARKAITAIATVTRWQRGSIRLVAIAVLVWVALYPLTLLVSARFGFGQVAQSFQKASLARDAFITYPFWVGLIFAIQISMPLLISDIVRLVLYPLYSKHRAGWLNVQSITVIALLAVGLVYVIARIYNDTFRLRTRETEVRIANLPKELDGFRIVQIADMQADGRTNGKLLDAYVDRINGLQPDIILFGGDMVTDGTDYIETGAQTLSKLEARYGVYACLGDHDFFADRDMVARSQVANGITLLDNSAKVIQVGPASLWLAGITNVYRARPAPRSLAAVEQQRPPDAPSILLTHQPSEWLVDYAAEHHYDLLTAGHTHGGQIVFPLPGFLLTGSSFETHYVTGFYHVGAALVSINNGLGLTLAAVRYHAPAEVTLLVLRAAE